MTIEEYLIAKDEVRKKLIKLKCLEHILEKECAGMSFFVDIHCSLQPYIKTSLLKLAELSCQEVLI